MDRLPNTTESLRHTFFAFTGTTLANYRISAYVTDEHIIVFDKSRNPKHLFDEIFFSITPRKTFIATAGLSQRTNSPPVIMGGNLSVEYLYELKLPPGIVFPVSRLWIPDPNIKFNDLLLNMYADNTGIVFDNFIEVDPLVWLTD